MIYYLAYGSNMATARLQQRVPAAQRIGLVELPGHLLTFDNLSTKDGSGKCAALPTGHAEDLVLAVLYRLPRQEKATLDGYEGLGVEYRDAFVPIRLPDGAAAEALIYYASNLASGLRPYHWYKEHVLRGAQENELPNAYIERIRCCASIDDPQPERQQREMSIYL